MLSEGQNPVFHCYASGWPEPSFAWLKEGRKIKNGDANNSYVLIRRPGGLDLDIIYVRRQEHAGRYTCLVNNTIGEQRHHILLSVVGQFQSCIYINNCFIVSGS